MDRPSQIPHWAALLLLGGACALLAAPASAQEGWDNAPTGKNTPLGVRKGPMDPYTAAMTFKQKGDYAQAIPLLQEIATRGAGYEIAQLELGRCYLEMGRREVKPQDAVADRTHGLGWVLLSAERGFGEAQVELVRLFLDGVAVPQNPIEGAKWYLLWRRNPSRMQIGASEFDAGLELRLKEDLTQAEWKDAENRAANWRPS